MFLVGDSKDRRAGIGLTFMIDWSCRESQILEFSPYTVDSRYLDFGYLE